MAFKITGQSFEAVNGRMFNTAAQYIDQIREGNVPDHTYVHIRGHAHAIGATDQELSALATAGFGNWPAAAAGAVLVSSDAQDNAAGTGARSVIVRGLDTNWAAATATIVPTGVTPTAATAQTFIRINEVEVVTAGSGLTNAGDLTISVGGANILKVFLDHSTSDAGRYSVPADMKMYLSNIEASAVGNKEVTYHIFCRDTKVANGAFQLRASWHSKDGGYRPNGRIEEFAEKVDMVMIAHAAGGGARGSGSVEGWIEVA
jgi:hypothetical protein